MANIYSGVFERDLDSRSQMETNLNVVAEKIPKPKPKLKASKTSSLHRVASTSFADNFESVVGSFIDEGSFVIPSINKSTAANPMPRNSKTKKNTNV